MPDFYHPDRETLKDGENLPHWQQGEVIQFVTFRLADSMPRVSQSWKGRDSSHFANAVRYLRRNSKNLKPGTFTLWQSERAQAIQ